jgi:hypothetical protein
MIQFEITQSDGPEFIGTWDFHWNKIILGGPKGLKFSSLTHPPITLSLYKNKYILFEALNFIEQVLLDGRKVTFPFVVPINSEVKTKYFTLVIRKFSLSQDESLEHHYKMLSAELNLNSPEANFIKKILEE